MSWYLSQTRMEIIGQFASISGLADLRNASDSYAALKDFFEVGATKNTTLCEFQLYRLAKKTKDQSIKSTAKGLAAMLRGEKIVWITDGTTGHPGSAELKESAVKSLFRTTGRSLPTRRPRHPARADQTPRQADNGGLFPPTKQSHPGGRASALLGSRGPQEGSGANTPSSPPPNSFRITSRR